METINCIVTYSGNITEKLKACGSLCHYRLTGDGNTEQIVECFRGMAAGKMKIEELAKQIEPFIVEECIKNGTVIGCRWVLVEI